jgi:cytochrome P450
VSAGLLSLHRRPEVYPDPPCWRLERLLGANPHRPPVPFAGGTRRCIGASFAQSEIRIALGQIVTVLRCVALLPAGEVPVFVTARRASKPAFSPGGSAHMICVLGCSISCRASARAAGRDSGGPDSRS